MCDRQTPHKWNVKVKVWTNVIALLKYDMSQIRDQQRFTISEVAADLDEAMVPQSINQSINQKGLKWPK